MSRLLLLILVLLLAACGEVESTVDQPRTMYATDERTGVFSIVLPPFWAGLPMQDASLMVGNGGKSVRAYETIITDLEAGMTAGTVSAVLRAALTEQQVTDSPDALAATITDALGAVTGSITYSFGSVELREIAGRAAAVRDGLVIAPGNPDTTEDDKALEVRVLVIESGAAYGVLFVAAPFGEMESYFEQWDSIAASFVFMTAEEARATQAAGS